MFVDFETKRILMRAPGQGGRTRPISVVFTVEWSRPEQTAAPLAGGFVISRYEKTPPLPGRNLAQGPTRANYGGSRSGFRVQVSHANSNDSGRIRYARKKVSVINKISDSECSKEIYFIHKKSAIHKIQNL